LHTGRPDSQSNVLYRVPEDLISAAAADLTLEVGYDVTGPDVDVDVDVDVDQYD